MGWGIVKPRPNSRENVGDFLELRNFGNIQIFGAFWCGPELRKQAGRITHILPRKKGNETPGFPRSGIEKI